MGVLIMMGILIMMGVLIMMKNRGGVLSGRKLFTHLRDGINIFVGVFFCGWVCGLIH